MDKRSFGRTGTETRFTDDKARPRRAKACFGRLAEWDGASLKGRRQQPVESRIPDFRPPKDLAMAKRAEDPVLISARREAIIVFATWVDRHGRTALIYCGRHAYGRSIDDLQVHRRLSRIGSSGASSCRGGPASCSPGSSRPIWMRDEDLGEDPPGTGTADELGQGG